MEFQSADIPIYIEQGKTYRERCRLLDENDEPIDLTGCSVKFSIKKTYDYPVETCVGSVIPDADQVTNIGWMDVLLTAPQTTEIYADRATGQNFDPSFYVYEMELTDAAGEIPPFRYGKVNFRPEVE